MAISELFTDVVVNMSEIESLSVVSLYELLREAENFRSIPKRFKFAMDKIRGVDPDPIKVTDDEFSIAMLRDIQTTMLRKNLDAQYEEAWDNHGF